MTGGAMWLFLSLPKWYFSSIGEPFKAGILSALPALGTVALVVGIVWGVVRRRSDLATFLILPAASQCLMIVAGFLMNRPAYASPAWWIFPLLQLLLAGYFIYRLEGARLAAAALAVFSVTYALFATFLAAMAIRGTWL